MKRQDFAVQLGSLGQVEFVRIASGGGDEIAELLGEAEGADRVLEKLRRAVEVGKLYGLRLDGFQGIGELGSDAAEGGLEGGDGGSDGSEGVISVLEGGELGEELVVAGEDLGAKLGFEKTDGVFELLGGGGGRTGGEGGGGEGGGGEVRREEGREDWV